MGVFKSFSEKAKLEKANRQADKLNTKLARIRRQQLNRDLQKMIKEHKQDIAMQKRQKRQEQISNIKQRASIAKTKISRFSKLNTKLLPNYSAIRKKVLKR